MGILQNAMDVTARKLVVSDFYDQLERLFHGSKPIAKLFRTRNKGYLYDTGTNKIVACDETECVILDYLFSYPANGTVSEALLKIEPHKLENSFRNILNTVEKENILLTRKAAQFALSSHFKDHEELIDTHLKQIQLEITENCNLRCRYCIYNSFVHNKRNHSEFVMDSNVAYRAIDYLGTHSKHRNRICISFYGGEPILRFTFIKECVAYAKRQLSGRTLDFSMTTNGTLLTEEMAQFLYSNGFSLTFSIDGPSDIHDEYRKDANGVGSFLRALTGLQSALDAFGPGARDRIMINMVYAPPFSENKLNRICELWTEYPSLLQGIRATITYPLLGTIAPDINGSCILREDKSIQKWAFEKYLIAYISKKPVMPLIAGIVETPLARLFQRPVYTKPVSNYHLNGCCIPGARKLYVTAKGNYYLCERMPTAARTIGNVFSGIDRGTIREIYVDGYAKASIADCSCCWAIQLCRICYALCSNSEGVDISRKRLECAVERKALEHALEFYCELLELDSRGLDFLKNFILE